MRWGLRKEARGRHALGAAVTAIPAAPLRPDEVPLLADQAWSERFPDAQADTGPAAATAESSVSAAVAPVVPAAVVPVPPEVEAEAPAPASAAAAQVSAPAQAEPQVALPAPVRSAPAGPAPSLQQLVPAQHLPVQQDVEPLLLDSFTSAPPPLQAPLPPMSSAAPAPPAPPMPAPPAAVAPAPPVPTAVPPPAPAPAPDGFAALAAFRPAVEAAAPLPAPAVAAVAPPGPRVEIGFADGTFRMLDPASSAAQELSDLVAELTSKDTGRGATAS